jgi:hypothetical protein
MRTLLLWCYMRRPWLLLLPNYVYLKEFYKELLGASPTAFFITPPKRYHYYRYLLLKQ